MKKTIALIVLLATVCLLLTGCDSNNDFSGELKDYYDIIMNNGIEHGLKKTHPIRIGGTAYEIYPLFCAYRSDKRVFDVDEVIVEFYYGGFYQNIESDSKAYDITSFKIVITDRDRLQNHEYVYERFVDENFVSEKYQCKLVTNSFSRVTEYKFNYSESIRLPRELFDKESGIIDFVIFDTNLSSPNPEEQLIVRTAFHYTVINGKVCLSNHELKLYKKFT